MAQGWNVKVKDPSNNSIEQVASFTSAEAAYSYKDKLSNGAGGLFGIRYEIFVEESNSLRIGIRTSKKKV